MEDDGMSFIGTAAEARAQLSALVSPAVVPPLSDADLDAALLQARLRDSEGRLPGADGYVGTYSIAYAASLVSQVRAIRTLSTEQLTKFTSEGSSFERTPVDWQRVADSFLAQAASDEGLSSGGLTVYGIRRECEPRLRPDFPWLTGVITNAD